MYKPLAVGLLMSLMLPALPAQGTVMFKLNNKELTERSQVVVQGRVVKQEVIWIQKRLWTDTYVRVSRSLKGDRHPGETVILRQPGGETATIGMKVSGAATFRLNEQVLVFGRTVAAQVYVVVGMAQGKFQISKDKRGVLQASRGLGSLAFARFNDQGKMTVVPPASAKSVPLEQLVRTIRSYASGIGGAK